MYTIVLRKNVVYDSNGTYIKEFFIYVKNNEIYCPLITSSMVNYATTSLFNCISAAFDTSFGFNPYTLYKNGELSMMYLLSQDYLESSVPTIKCDIIDAKNALTLHESDVYYFYKPSIITETDEYYKMVYKLPNNYTIPDNLNFTFTEHCFGNRWNLTWKENQWSGKNIKGKINGKVINKCNLPADETWDHYHGSHIMIRKQSNDKYIKVHEGNSNLMYSMIQIFC